VYLEKSPKWSPYGIALSMALMGRHFEEVYKKPKRCGHEAQSCLRNKDMKDNVNVGNISHRWIVLVMSFSSDRWYAMWFLMVEEL
jgi:hypothetical protein